jgi:hypothetical protein
MFAQPRRPDNSRYVPLSGHRRETVPVELSVRSAAGSRALIQRCLGSFGDGRIVELATFVAVLGAAYILSRGIAKAGTDHEARANARRRTCT